MKIDILKVGTDPILHFEAVARLQSLKLAAGELGLSQPAVTHSLSKLEGNLGVQLCVRTRTQFALTESGKRLFKLAREIRQGLQEFQDFINHNESFDGLFSVGILSLIQNEKFENAIEKTVRAFPKMKLSIQAYTAGEMQNLVSVGELDVGIGIFNSKLAHLSYQVVGKETICHYISDKHPLWKRREITEEDLRNQVVTWGDIIKRDKLTLAAEIFGDNRRGIKNVRSYTDSLLAAVWILRSGTSIVPLPAEFLASQEIDFKYRSLNSIRKPYVLNQEMVSRRDFANASIATKFFLKQLS